LPRIYGSDEGSTGEAVKLRYSPTSPYVRKVLVAAIEVGLKDEIEIILTEPWDPETPRPTYPVTTRLGKSRS
jgi:glutathione S-transferase